MKRVPAKRTPTIPITSSDLERLSPELQSLFRQLVAISESKPKSKEAKTRILNRLKFGDR